MDKPEKDKPSPQPRRPYEPPRVEESASFEHLVLTCTHINPVRCGGNATTRS